ncbi:hypothetical protein ACLIA0_07555 [Bacillaceae bacterium W0354]
MSLTRVSLFENVKRQFVFKIKAFQSVFTTMIIIQLIAMVFSLSGVGSSGSGYNHIFIDILYYSSDMVVIFTLIWGFIIAATITKPENRLMDFTFVTNHLSSHLSNIAFIVFMCLIGGATSILAGFLLKLVSIVIYGADQVIVIAHYTITEVLLGITVVTIYLLLLSGLGYLVGMLIQWNPIFKFIIPAIFVALLFLSSFQPFLGKIVSFYVQERDLDFIFFKVLITVIVCFTVSTILSKRMEVRQ